MRCCHCLPRRSSDGSSLRNPNRGDMIALLIQELTTPARWQKAVQHLREDGKLEGSPRDIVAHEGVRRVYLGERFSL